MKDTGEGRVTGFGATTAGREAAGRGGATRASESKRQRIRRLVLFGMFLIFPITLNYFSPALLLEGAAKRIAVASLIVWGAFFLTSLFVGRAACGYFCPLGGLQMIKDRVAPKPLKEVRRLRAIKYVFWTVWVGAIVAMLATHGLFNSFQPLYKTPTGISVDGIGSLVTYFFLVGIVLLPLLLGKRGFCHYFCPFSVFNILGTRIKGQLGYPSLHLESDAGRCRDCGRCDRSCPMSLPVSGMVASGDMSNTECILCASCVDNCPAKAIRYALKRGETAAVEAEVEATGADAGERVSIPA